MGNSASYGAGVAVVVGGDGVSVNTTALAVTLVDSIFRSNIGEVATQQGGALYLYATGGSSATQVQLLRTVVSGHEASVGGGVFLGWEEYRSVGAAVSIVNSTIVDNTAAGDGGGVYSQHAGSNATADDFVLSLSRSTVSNNGAGGGGGGIFVSVLDLNGISNFTVRGEDSVVADNVAGTCCVGCTSLTGR